MYNLQSTVHSPKKGKLICCINSQLAQLEHKHKRAYHITSPILWSTLEVDKIQDCSWIEESKPIYIVGEVGKEDNHHIHMYFWSSFSVNTVKKRLVEIGVSAPHYSDPNANKYRKYDTEDMKGVEIYLSKGITNHMQNNDALTCMPKILYTNLPSTKLTALRKKYESIISNMRAYKKTVRELNQSRKKEEWDLILKDISNGECQSPEDIYHYLCYKHYCRKAYLYNENAAARLYLSILKLTAVQKYSTYILNNLHNKLIRYEIPSPY